MKLILLHGSGHRADSWQETVARMKTRQEVLCPDLAGLLGGREASYANLCAAFSEYCGRLDGPLRLCGLSLGGILALEYTLAHPEKVQSLVLIGTPHRVPKAAFALQNLVFRLLPRSAFDGMALNKRDTFLLGRSMRDLDFRGRVEGIRCPTHIVCGERDKANRAAAAYFAQAIPGAALTILENTGHVVNEENPEALARILDAMHTPDGLS